MISPRAAGSAASAPPRRSAISVQGRSRTSPSWRKRQGCYEAENRRLDRDHAFFDFAQNEEIISLPFRVHLMLSEVEARTAACRKADLLSYCSAQSCNVLM